jgi:hypothetical protein
LLTDAGINNIGKGNHLPLKRNIDSLSLVVLFSNFGDE